ncbi:MAG: D-alanyl-D-alanine carboxypeptidase, partial [Nitrospinota bacterium]
MRKRLLLTLCLLAGLLAAWGPALGAEGIRDLKSFRLRVQRILKSTCPKGARLGVRIQSLNKGDVLFDHKGGELFVPASNVKLITTAAALRALGPDYTFKTTLYFEGRRSGGTLKGNLYFKGSGDPTLVSERLWLLARGVAWRGIKRIEGDLVADDSFFEAEEKRRKPKGIAAYGALPGALSLNFNVATLYISPGARKGARPRVVLDPESEYLKIKNLAATGAR